MTQPLLKRDGDVGANRLGRRDRAVGRRELEGVDRAAAGAVGAIGGGRLLNEEAFCSQHVYRALGVENLDWRAGAQTLVHHGGFARHHADLENAQARSSPSAVRPSQLAPVLDLRIRKAVAHHGAR